LKIRKKVPGKKTPKILFFFPYCTFPPMTGAHVRCLENLTGLIKLGYEITFLGIENYSKKTWTPESVVHLKNIGVKNVEIYQITLYEFLINALIIEFYLLFNRIPPMDSLIYSPFGMRIWFRKIQVESNPEIIWMNYSNWDKLLDYQKKDRAVLIIDYLDLASLNDKMKNAIMRKFSQSIPFSVLEADVLNEDYLSSANFSIEQNESRIITGYDKVIAISQNEATLLRQFNEKVPIFFIPVTVSPVDCENTYEGLPVFSAGPNVFNVQGLYFFIEKVLPKIRNTIPDFSLNVTGTCCNLVQPHDSISLKGFVKDLKETYCSARFSICPVLGGTGQQIKIIEAMAHGLPVVATKYSASTSPIVHGHNGFIAENAKEFAEHCIKLWQNPKLCKEMGIEARKTIQKNYSEEILLKKLSEVLNSP